MPAHGTASRMPAAHWEEAFVSGNGRLGAMFFGEPGRETIVGNHGRLFLPLGNREIVPDLAHTLPELRALPPTEGRGFFYRKAKEAGLPESLIWPDPYHPGFFLTLGQTVCGSVTDYFRTEDFATGQIDVRWSDDSGIWRRKLFVSRQDNMIVLSVSGPGNGQVNCTLTSETIEKPEVKSELNVGVGLATYHNIYVHGKGGWDVAIRVETKGGTIRADGRSMQVSGADEITVLMRIAPWKIPHEGSEAWAFNHSHSDFAEGKLGQYIPAPNLSKSSVTAYLNAVEACALMPAVEQALAGVIMDYDVLLAAHARRHGELFDRMSVDLGGGADRAKTSEELLDAAQEGNCLPPALLEKLFDSGRYMFICCAGERTPNLQGIWTGTWSPAWSGDYTTDTNVQLAIRAAYAGNLADLMEGYFSLIEDALPDWRLNARRYYGCRGVMAPSRMSNTGLMIHWNDEWPLVFWTAGASWLARAFMDYYEFTGDKRFLLHRVVPLLKETVLFYEDFMKPQAVTGLYEFNPSYSPESSSGITSTMDVMAARDAISSLIEACGILQIEQENVAKWNNMLTKLPAYRINADGALAEWISPGEGEHYRHRHLSHLHAAYEANGEALSWAPELWSAAQEATRKRIDSDGEQSTHGRMHMGLAAAHLGMAEEAWGRLAVMATRRSVFSSLICGHDPGPAIFNTDGNGAIPEIVGRLLVRSVPGRLDLLPALPSALNRGEIRGLPARRGIRLERLVWDVPAGTVEVDLASEENQTVSLRFPGLSHVSTIAVDGRSLAAAPGGGVWLLELQANRTTHVSAQVSHMRGGI